jgi:hypothetical protein
MPVAREVQAGWERRFPELKGKWTHWRIKGDGDRIAEVAGSDLFRALRVVEANFGRFRSMKAVRALADPSGGFAEERVDHEISNYEYDAAQS